MKNVALIYRVLAWVVGINLILVVTGFVGQKTTEPDSWFNRNDGLITAVDLAHGWMFMVLVVLIVVLARHHRWEPWFLISTALLATIPIVSFWAERRASHAIERAERGADSPVGDATDR